jgi:DNA-binding transcriptional regulator GbsR (MarR family)
LTAETTRRPFGSWKDTGSKRSFFLEQIGRLGLIIPVVADSAISTVPSSSPGVEEIYRQLEVEVIDLFVGLARVIGMPRSLGELYGLLFISRQPLPMDDIISRLNISKGSASQGLKFLRGLGAVKPVYVPGDRRDHYVAELDLKKLAGGVIREELQPHLDNGSERLERMAGLIKRLPGEEQEIPETRLGRLSGWQKKSRLLLPVVLKVLGE